MKHDSYTVLGILDPAEYCYLDEVLLWRAFSRFPEAYYHEDGDARFLNRDSYNPPQISSEYIEDAECLYAEIPPDPRLAELLSDRSLSDVGSYDKYIDIIEKFDPPDLKQLEKYKKEKIEAQAHHEEVEIWQGYYDDYVDQFKNEICLALRQGRITAYATELPHANREKSEVILEKRDIWLDDLKVTKVPKECWISTNIDWFECSLTWRHRAFVWVHVSVKDILEVFPPTMAIDKEKLMQSGQRYFLSASGIPAQEKAKSSRGRPSLPWENFHLEVARLFREAAMPEKKEAAIAVFQEWFLVTHGKTVSRSALGQKLKPYFDDWTRKDR